MKLDNKSLWNEAGRVGFVFGGFSSLCLLRREGAALTKSSFLIQAAAIILWAVEFFGCILLMKNLMLRLRDRHEGTTFQDTYVFGRRAALMSGLLLATAQALIGMYMPAEALNSLVDQAMQTLSLSGSERDQVESVADKLPLLLFFFQWLYCFLYGSVLSSLLSRYIFLEKMIGNPPDEQ